MLEGYLLYQALVVVFDTGDNKKMPLYLFGYGVPLAIVMITLVTAIVVERYGNTGCGAFKAGIQIRDILPKNQHTQRKLLNF